MVINLEISVKNLDLTIKALKYSTKQSRSARFLSGVTESVDDIEELESIIKALEHQRNQYVVSRTFPGS
jgi:hypothetical protein